VNPTTVAWRGLTMATGQDTGFRILTVEGWEELPAPRYEKTPRSRAHGAHPSRVWADERIVTVTGFCWSAADRDAMLSELQAGLVFGADEEPLTVTAAGRTLTASAQLLAARQALLRGEWGIGRFGWVAQWRCPDPLRYGPAQPSQSVGLPTSGGGLAYPLAYDLDYGAAGEDGSLTLTNPGTAPAPVVMEVRGPLERGFEVSAGGQRLRYPVPIPAGQVIRIDTGAGTVLVEGTADRRTNLTIADWMQVPALGSLTLQLTSLGGAYDAAAGLTVPSFRGAYW
jgi:hypothetical protein